MMTLSRLLVPLLLAALAASALAAEPLNQPPEGFKALFNGQNLDGWWGLATTHYKKYRDLSPDEFAAMQEKSRDNIRQHWSVEDGVLVNDGHGLFLSTNTFYGDFELLVDYKTVAKADSGIYLRGIPQIQIWDYTKEGGKWKIGADKGSGGLWNNPKGSPGKDPLVLADKPFGQWNHFRIKMIGPYVNVWLNGEHVVRDAELRNYFEKKMPVPPDGPIELQTHGGEIRWRNVFIREIPHAEANTYLAGLGTEGYEPIFNGKDFDGWAGPVDKNRVADGAILSSHGIICTKATYGDFAVRFEFKVPPGGNNGLALRYPGTGDTAYTGMCELQVLDNTAPKFAKLKPHQYHGSIYGMVPALRGYLRPAGEWNFQEVTVRGHRITVRLNGYTITDADLATVDPSTFMYPAERFKGHLRTEGHFGFAGHGAPVSYRNILLKRLD